MSSLAAMASVALRLDDGGEVAGPGEPSLLFAGLLLASGILGIRLGTVAMGALVPRRPSEAAVPWTALHVLGLALFTFALVVVLGAAAGSEWSPLTGLWITVCVLGAPAGLAVFLAARRGGFAALGWGRGGEIRGMAAGLGGYLLVLPGWWGLGILWEALVSHLGHAVAPQAVMTGILSLEGSALALALVLATVVAPLLEEILFRGFLQPLLVSRWGAAGGIAATALLFAVLHGAVYTPPLFAVGVILGVVRWRTGSLTAAWAVHGTHNAIMLLLALTLPELTDSVTTGS